MRGSGSFVMFLNIHVFYSLSAILRVFKIQIKNKIVIGMTTCDAKMSLKSDQNFSNSFATRQQTCLITCSAAVITHQTMRHCKRSLLCATAPPAAVKLYNWLVAGQRLRENND